MAARIQQLSFLEEEIYRRSQHVPLSMRLTFVSLPTSHSDPMARPADIPANAPYLEHRNWLEARMLDMQTKLKPLGNKDADGRCRANISRLTYQLKRLQHIAFMSWDHAKVISNVPGYYILPGSTKAELVPPRE